MNERITTNYLASRSSNIQVWIDTRELFEGKLSKVNERTVSTKYTDLSLQLVKRYKKTMVRVVDMDTLDAGIKLREKGYRPVVLNMSDWNFPGGCVDTGAETQEEDLFRRSNYFTSLTKEYYPMEGKETVYTKNAFVVKSNAKSGYKLLGKVCVMDFIANPALANPDLDESRERFDKQEDIELMKNKMRMIFKVAYGQGNDSLVLSAWGCGAFHCPARHVAGLFKEVLEEFEGCFKVVIFAILGGNGFNNKMFRTVFEQED